MDSSIEFEYLKSFDCMKPFSMLIVLGFFGDENMKTVKNQLKDVTGSGKYV